MSALVTIVHKANVLSVSDGLFRESALKVGENYKGRVAIQEQLVRYTGTRFGDHKYTIFSCVNVSTYLWIITVLKLSCFICIMTGGFNDLRNDFGSATIGCSCCS